MKDILIRHIRNSNNVPVATVVAVKTPEGVRTGYSICHSRLDRYNKKEGVQRAKFNALDGIRPAAKFRTLKQWDSSYETIKDVSLMNIIERYEENLRNRANRYFKVDVPAKEARYEKMSLNRRIGEGLLLLEDGDVRPGNTDVMVFVEKPVHGSICNKLRQLGWRTDNMETTWIFDLR